MRLFPLRTILKRRRALGILHRLEWKVENLKSSDLRVSSLLLCCSRRDAGIFRKKLERVRGSIQELKRKNANGELEDPAEIEKSFENIKNEAEVLRRSDDQTRQEDQRLEARISFLLDAISPLHNRFEKDIGAQCRSLRDLLKNARARIATLDGVKQKQRQVNDRVEALGAKVEMALESVRAAEHTDLVLKRIHDLGAPNTSAWREHVDQIESTVRRIAESIRHGQYELAAASLARVKELEAQIIGDSEQEKNRAVTDIREWRSFSELTPHLNESFGPALVAIEGRKAEQTFLEEWEELQRSLSRESRNLYLEALKVNQRSIQEIYGLKKAPIRSGLAVTSDRRSPLLKASEIESFARLVVRCWSDSTP